MQKNTEKKNTAAGRRKNKTNKSQIKPKQNKPKLKAKQPVNTVKQKKEMLANNNVLALLVKGLGKRVN